MENIKFAIDQTNVEQQKAFDLVENTNTSLFITGKAGTGKTTFIKGIQKLIKKDFLVLAPTGIAAMNVGGQTLHSFFGLPFTAMGPRDWPEVSENKRDVLMKIDTIIIDEASMVRCDWVDAIDRFLRSLTKSRLPFGGKQVVFVGDLFQLPPVVKSGSADDELLSEMYGNGTPYFYKANVMKRINLPKIEFQKVYRQNDIDFLGILNRMRLGENTISDLNILNQHVSCESDVGEYAVTLTAFNKSADQINDLKLSDIDADEYCYEGEIDGDFHIKDSPVPMQLRLKEGAQVIICRNDFSQECVNGTIAIVSKLDEDGIQVRLKNGKQIAMKKMIWESRESVYNVEKMEVESQVVGTFTQYPLKLAWAITIHKSQGMTFDRMHLDLTRGTFAPGQTYVAVSRMRTLEGLTISNKVQRHHIIQNAEIKAYSNSFNNMAVIDEELLFGQMLYKNLAKEDYDGAVKVCLRRCLEMMKSCDYRNAALMAKKMYDVMLDDKCLRGMTKRIPLLKDCSMTCNFLNAMLCLYGGRLEEAVGYANLVLDRRSCSEAMFIKGKALQRLNRYEEAMEMANLIHTPNINSDETDVVDMKQYLFEAELNARLGNSNLGTCQHLIKLAPKYTPTYLMVRKESLANNVTIEMDEDENENALVAAFNDATITNTDFKKMLDNSDKENSDFMVFSRKIRKIKMAAC